jgi:hypothetical protein
MLHKVCGGIAGTGAMGALGFVIAALQGGGKVDLLWLGAVISAVVAFGGIGGWLLASDSDSQPRQSSTGNQSPNVYTQGENSPINVNINAPPQFKMHWLDRPGAPQFRLESRIDNREGATQLLCEIYITDANPMPGGLQARWVHPGIEVDWTTPMPANTSMRGARKFQMKPVQVIFTPPGDSVTFQVKFNLDDGEHGGSWTWPVRQHEKGHWIMDQHLGSHIFQPGKEDSW